MNEKNKTIISRNSPNMFAPMARLLGGALRRRLRIISAMQNTLQITNSAPTEIPV